MIGPSSPLACLAYGPLVLMSAPREGTSIPSSQHHRRVVLSCAWLGGVAVSTQHLLQKKGGGKTTLPVNICTPYIHFHLHLASALPLYATSLVGKGSGAEQGPPPPILGWASRSRRRGAQGFADFARIAPKPFFPKAASLTPLSSTRVGFPTLTTHHAPPTWAC